MNLVVSFSFFAAFWLAIHCKLIRLHVAVTVDTSSFHQLLQTSIISHGSSGKRIGLSSNRAPISTSSADASWSPSLPRVLALYFPQFHADPINDRLWGVNFTDWDSLRDAPTHNRLGQPIPRPTELGYYDLSDATSDTAKRQGELAKEYGVDGFAYHHYWFYDREHPGPNLHAPLELLLKTGNPDIPFCLHWAAQKWTSTWTREPNGDAAPPKNKVLQMQYFPNMTTAEGKKEARDHYVWLRKIFEHPNYIKIEGAPLFMIYQKKPAMIPLLKQLRRWARKDGFSGLYFTVGLTRPHEHLQSFWPFRKMHRFSGRDLFKKIVNYPNPSEWNNRSLEIPDWCSMNPNAIVGEKANSQKARTDEIVGILTSFDNTPRRPSEEAVILNRMDAEGTIEQFRKSLKAALYYESCCFLDDKSESIFKKNTHTASKNNDKFVLINAWNEWAEGMSLEPSDVYGRRLLETIRDVKEEVIRRQCQWRNDAVPESTNSEIKPIGMKATTNNLWGTQSSSWQSRLYEWKCSNDCSCLPPIPEDNSTIIMHQSYKSFDKRTWKSGWNEFRESWIHLHPDWHFIFWTDEQNDLLAKCLGYPTIFKQRSGIQKADLSRLMYMHRYGGFYADIDYIALRNHNSLFDDPKYLNRNILLQGRRDQVVGLEWGYSRLPNQSLWKFCLDIADRQVVGRLRLVVQFSLLVPKFLERCIKKYYKLTGDLAHGVPYANELVIVEPDLIAPLSGEDFTSECGTFRGEVNNGREALLGSNKEKEVQTWTERWQESLCRESLIKTGLMPSRCTAIAGETV